MEIMATKKEKNYSDTKEGQDYLKERKKKPLNRNGF
jgi:hypothetical protein